MMNLKYLKRKAVENLISSVYNKIEESHICNICHETSTSMLLLNCPNRHLICSPCWLNLVYGNCITTLLGEKVVTFEIQKSFKCPSCNSEISVFNGNNKLESAGLASEDCNGRLLKKIIHIVNGPPSDELKSTSLILSSPMTLKCPFEDRYCRMGENRGTGAGVCHMAVDEFPSTTEGFKEVLMSHISTCRGLMRCKFCNLVFEVAKMNAHLMKHKYYDDMVDDSNAISTDLQSPYHEKSIAINMDVIIYLQNIIKVVIANSISTQENTSVMIASLRNKIKETEVLIKLSVLGSWVDLEKPDDSKSVLANPDRLYHRFSAECQSESISNNFFSKMDDEAVDVHRDSDSDVSDYEDDDDDF